MLHCIFSGFLLVALCVFVLTLEINVPDADYKALVVVGKIAVCGFLLVAWGMANWNYDEDDTNGDARFKNL